MSQGSPSAQRVIAILNFFADHPGQAFSLTDLVRSLRLSRATAHAFLTTLANAGYLYRATDKTYVLGPALAAIGQVASEYFSPLQIAQPEMRRLADEFDVVCSAVFRDGRDIVVRDRATSRSNLGFSLPSGGRLPLRPPFGGIFFARAPQGSVEQWFERLDPPGLPDQWSVMMQGLAFVREHGFQFTIRTMREQPDSMSPDWLFVEQVEDRPILLGTSLDPQASYQLASVTAPVFGPQDKVAFVLALVGFNGVFTGDQVAGIGKSLREASERISGFLGGVREAA
jgi:DNA-binding IclR family transcriptional regulator